MVKSPNYFNVINNYDNCIVNIINSTSMQFITHAELNYTENQTHGNICSLPFTTIVSSFKFVGRQRILFSNKLTV